MNTAVHVEGNNSGSQHPVGGSIPNCSDDVCRKEHSDKNIEISELGDSIVCSKHQNLHDVQVEELNNLLFDCN